MNYRLTTREICRLHSMYSAGSTTTQIATALGVNPRTVYDHISMRVSYPSEVYRKIGKSPKLLSATTMPIYDSAIFLPGWPSRDKTYRLYRAGVLGTTNRPKRGEKLMTSIPHLRKCAKRMLPSGNGIFISHATLSAIAPGLARHIGDGVRLKYWPARLQIFYPMTSATRAAIEQNYALSIPAPLIHRAILVLDTIGVATI